MIDFVVLPLLLAPMSIFVIRLHLIGSSFVRESARCVEVQGQRSVLGFGRAIVRGVEEKLREEIEELLDALFVPGREKVECKGDEGIAEFVPAVCDWSNCSLRAINSLAV